MRDDEGNLKVVYHSTFEDFYTFDRGRLGENTLGNASNAGLAATSLIGHWFSDHDLSGQLGEKTTMSYLNMENPHVVSSLDDLASEIIALSDDPDMIQDEYEYGNYEPLREAAAAYVDALRNEGYDGIITTDEEFGGNSYVVLDSAQAKLTTNLNPTQNPDIRYSQRVREGDQVERLAKQNEVLEKEVEYLKELVKIQKRGNRDNILDRNSVNKQGKALMDSVNAKGSSQEFNRMLNDLYQEMTTTEMDFETMKEKAGMLADWLMENHISQRKCLKKLLSHRLS